LYQSNEEGNYFSYIPGEAAFVHNANLWTAALVAKSGKLSNNFQMIDQALLAARQTASMQQNDGSWTYGTRHHHRFIDGFHTGYNLEALSMLDETLGTNDFHEFVSNGMEYYRKNFFLADGTVKYFNDKIWPLDTHSFAQAILTLEKVGGTERDSVLADRAVERLISTLYLPRAKRFGYQKQRFLFNKINYLRWTQAWAFYALSSHLISVSKRAQAIKKDKKNDETI
jgi:polysaccharide biosynthesis protein VpsJ